MAARVFAPPPEGPAELAFLEGLTHPRITARMEERLRKPASDSGEYRVVVLDAPVLHKAGWDAYCDLLLFVDADEGLRAARATAAGVDERSGVLGRRPSPTWPISGRGPTWFWTIAARRRNCWPRRLNSGVRSRRTNTWRFSGNSPSPTGQENP